MRRSRHPSASSRPIVRRRGWWTCRGPWTSSDKQLAGLADRVVEARTKRDDLQGLYDQIQRAGKLSSAELAAHPTLARNATIQALKASELQAEREVSELAKRYGPAAPQDGGGAHRISIRSRAKLATEVGNAVAGVRKELDIAGAQAEKLEAELAAAKIQRPGYQSPGVHPACPQARRGVGSPALRSVPDALQGDQPRCGRGVHQCPHHRCRRGSRRRRSSPRSARIVAVATLLALIVGVGLALLMEYLDNTLKSGQDVEESLLLPLLGHCAPPEWPAAAQGAPGAYLRRSAQVRVRRGHSHRAHRGGPVQCRCPPPGGPGHIQRPRGGQDDGGHQPGHGPGSPGQGPADRCRHAPFLRGQQVRASGRRPGAVQPGGGDGG